jgi:hypothetical protein
MKTNIKQELKNLFVNRWIKVYQSIDSYNDYVYVIDINYFNQDCWQLYKQIIEIDVSDGQYILTFDDGELVLWLNEDFELFDTNPETNLDEII